jgi:hypothetical protein
VKVFFELTIDGPQHRLFPAIRHAIKFRPDIAVKQLIFHVIIGMAGQAIAKLAVLEHLPAIRRIASHTGQRFLATPSSVNSTASGETSLAMAAVDSATAAIAPSVNFIRLVIWRSLLRLPGHITSGSAPIPRYPYFAAQSMQKYDFLNV